MQQSFNMVSLLIPIDKNPGQVLYYKNEKLCKKELNFDDFEFVKIIDNFPERLVITFKLDDISYLSEIYIQNKDIYEFAKKIIKPNMERHDEILRTIELISNTFNRRKYIIDTYFTRIYKYFYNMYKIDSSRNTYDDVSQYVKEHVKTFISNIPGKPNITILDNSNNIMLFDESYPVTIKEYSENNLVELEEFMKNELNNLEEQVK